MAKVSRPLANLDPITGKPITPNHKYVVGANQAGYMPGTLSAWSDIDLSEFNRLVPMPVLTGNESEDYARLSEIRAQNQGAFEQWRNGTAKFVGKTATAVAGALIMIPSTIGVGLGQIADLAIPGDAVQWRDIYDNAFQKGLDSANAWQDKNLPNYYTKAEQDMTLGRQLLTSNFWANDFLGGMSFMTGAILSEMLASYITAVTLGAGAPAQLAVTQGILARAAKVMKGIQKTAPIDDVVRGYQSLGKSGSAFQTIQGVRSFFTGAGYEAGVEARHFLNEAESELISNFVDTFGRQPDEEELNEIKEKTGRLANGVFATNLMLVGSSNAMLFAKTFAPVRNLLANAKKAVVFTPTPIAEKFLSPFVKEGEKLALRNVSKWEKALVSSYKLLQKPFIEGVWEEGLQGVTGSAALDFAMKKYSFDGADSTYTMAEAGIKGFEEAYGTKQGQKEVLIGAIMGLVGSPVTKFEGSAIKDVVDYLRSGDTNKAIADRYNNYQTLPSVQAYVRANNRSFELNQTTGQAADNGDFFKAKNAEDDDLFNLLSARHDTNYLDQVLDDFDAAVADYLASSEEDGYKKMAVDFGFDPNTSITEMKDRLKEVRGGLDSKIESFKRAKELAKDILVKPDRDVEEGLTYTLYSLDRKGEREKQVASEIQALVGEVDTRTLEEIRNSNLSILFSRNWVKTFEGEVEDGKLILDILRLDLQDLYKSYQAKLDEYDALSQRQPKLPVDAKTEKAKVFAQFKDILNQAESIKKEIDAKEAKIEASKKRIAAKVAKEYQSRNNTAIPYDMDSDEFKDLVDKALALRTKVSKHYKTDRVNKQKLESLFDDLHRLSAFRQRHIMEYNMFTSQAGQENFADNVAELRRLIKKEIDSRLESESNKATKLLNNKQRVKKLAKRFFGNTSDEAKERLVEFFQDSLSIDESVVKAMTSDINNVDKLVDQATKVSAGHEYSSNLFRNMGAILKAGKQVKASAEAAASPAVPPDGGESLVEGSPMPVSVKEGSAPVPLEGVVEGVEGAVELPITPASGPVFLDTIIKDDAVDISDVEAGTKPVDIPEVTSTPGAVDISDIVDNTGKGAIDIVDSVPAKNAVITSPSELTWIWADYPEARDEELYKEGIVDYPEATRDAMDSYEASPKAENLRMVIEQWDPASQGLAPEIPTASDKVRMQRTIYVNGKHYRARVFVRKDSTSSWQEVGSLLNPARYVGLDGKPLDLTKKSDRAKLNSNMADSQALADTFTKLTDNKSLWAWIRMQIDKGGADVSGATLAKVLRDTGVEVQLYAFKLIEPRKALDRQKAFGGQGLFDKYDPQIHGKEITIAGKKQKALVYVDTKGKDGTINFSLLYIDEKGNRLMAKPDSKTAKALLEEYKSLREQSTNPGSWGKFRSFDKVVLFEYRGKKMWTGILDAPVSKAVEQKIDTALGNIFVKDENGLYEGQKYDIEKAERLDVVKSVEDSSDTYISIVVRDNDGNMVRNVFVNLNLWVEPTSGGTAILSGATSNFTLQLSLNVGGTYISFAIRPDSSGIFYIQPQEKGAQLYRTDIGETLTLQGILDAVTTSLDVFGNSEKSGIATYLSEKGLNVQAIGFRQGGNKGESETVFDALPLMQPKHHAEMKLIRPKKPKASKQPEIAQEVDISDVVEEEISIADIVQEKVLGKASVSLEDIPAEETVDIPAAPATTSSISIDDDAEFEDVFGQDDIPFKITNNVADAELESFDQAKANIQSILDVEVSELETVLGNIANKGITVGAFMDSVVYLSNKHLPKGTEWHEAFHVVFRTFLSNSQISRYLSLARDRYKLPNAEALAKFRAQSASRKDLTTKQLEDLWLEEAMADDFMEFQRNPNYDKTKEHNGVFSRLWNWLLKQLGLYSEKVDDIESLFQDISLGKFKSAKPAYNVFRLRREPAFLNFPVVDNSGEKQKLGFGRLLSKDIHMLSSLVYDELNKMGVEKPNQYHVGTVLNRLRSKFDYREWDKVGIPQRSRTAFLQRIVALHAAVSMPGQEIFTLDENNEPAPIDFVGTGSKAPSRLKALEMAWDENVKEIMKDISLMAAIYTKESFDWESVEDGDGFAEYEEDSSFELVQRGSDMYGGLASTSKAFRQYILTTYGNMDYFELGLSADILKSNNNLFRFPANPAVLYNGILAGLRDTQRKLVMSKFIRWSKDNPNSTLLKERLARDIQKELDANGITVTDIDSFLSDVANVPTLEQNSNYYNLFVDNFTKHGKMYMDLKMDPSKDSTLVEPLNANQQDTAALQTNRWRADMSRRRDVINEEMLGKNNFLANRLRDIAEIVEDFNGRNVDDTIKRIKFLLSEVGIELSSGYLRYSLFRSKDFTTMPGDEELINFGSIFDDLNVPILTEHIAGLISGAESSNSVAEFFTHPDKGAAGRLLELADSNAWFDENLFRTSIQNSNGERVYPISSPSFTSTIALLYRNKNRRQFVDSLRKLAKKHSDKAYENSFKLFKQYIGDELGLEDYQARRYFDNIKNNPLLLGLNSQGEFSDKISDDFLDNFIDWNLFGVRIDYLDEAEDTGEVIEKNWIKGYRGSSDYSDLDEFSKLMVKLSLWLDSTATINRISTEKVLGRSTIVEPFRLFVPAVLEAKKTSKSYPMPVLAYTKGQKLSKTGLKAFKLHLQREVDNILKTKKEIADIVAGKKVNNIVKNYHYVEYKGQNVTYHEGKYYTITHVFAKNKYGAVQMQQMRVEEWSGKDTPNVLPKLRGLQLFDMKVLPTASAIEASLLETGAIPADTDAVINQYMQDKFHKFVGKLVKNHAGARSVVSKLSYEEKVEYLKASPAIKSVLDKIKTLVCK